MVDPRETVFRIHSILYHKKKKKKYILVIKTRDYLYDYLNVRELISDHLFYFLSKNIVKIAVYNTGGGITSEPTNFMKFDKILMV